MASERLGQMGASGDFIPLLFLRLDTKSLAGIYYNTPLKLRTKRERRLGCVYKMLVCPRL